jgi:urea transport system permease protein
MTTHNSSTLQLPKAPALLGSKGWIFFLTALVTICMVVPVLNLWVPADSVLHMSDYAVALVGKIMCYAICALAMDLIWGYTGILSLGHGTKATYPTSWCSSIGKPCLGIGPSATASSPRCC